jgi:hypothetical protein
MCHAKAEKVPRRPIGKKEGEEKEEHGNWDERHSLAKEWAGELGKGRKKRGFLC